MFHPQHPQRVPDPHWSEVLKNSWCICANNEVSLHCECHSIVNNTLPLPDLLPPARTQWCQKVGSWGSGCTNKHAGEFSFHNNGVVRSGETNGTSWDTEHPYLALTHPDPAINPSSEEWLEWIIFKLLNFDLQYIWHLIIFIFIFPLFFLKGVSFLGHWKSLKTWSLELS